MALQRYRSHRKECEAKRLEASRSGQIEEGHKGRSLGALPRPDESISLLAIWRMNPDLIPNQVARAFAVRRFRENL